MNNDAMQLLAVWSGWLLLIPTAGWLVMEMIRRCAAEQDANLVRQQLDRMHGDIEAMIRASQSLELDLQDIPAGEVA